MSDEKIKRRRFLADILFAGGAISAAALLAKATQGPGRPIPTPTPACSQPSPASVATPEVQLDGDIALPQAQPSKTPEPALGGKVVQPQSPQVKGDFVQPRAKPIP